MVKMTRSPIPKCNDYRKKEGANYDVYRYNELVAIQRKNEDVVYHDTILNLIEIETFDRTRKGTSKLIVSVLII